MDNASQIRAMRQLLIAAAAGEADEAQWKELTAILTESEEARDCAIALLDQMTSLEWNAQPRLSNLVSILDCPDEEFTTGKAGRRISRLSALLIGGSLAAAALVIGLSINHRSEVDPKHDRETTAASVLKERATNPIGSSDSLPGDGPAVARLMEMTSDASWAPGAGPDEFLLRLSSGERLELLSGFARIEFFSGAVVILEGPCVFIPTGIDSAALVRGRITGRADDGNFRLSTPSARVVDLGTEFGVEVDGSLTTDVIVFEGSVSVSPKHWRVNQQDALLLEMGGTARIRHDGDFMKGIVVKTAAFHRDLPQGAEPLLNHEPPSISLVDVVCRDGGRTMLAASIDPLTGGRDHRPWEVPYGPGYTKSDDKYHRVAMHPMLDGVFIPAPRGKDVVVSSDDHRYTLPAHDGVTWGPIWARRRVVGRLPEAANDYWGTGTLQHLTNWLETSHSGLLGIHANVGITFDLDACGEEFRGRFRSFDGTFVKLDLAAEIGAEHIKRLPVRTVDFWVVVDGKLRFSQRDIGFSKEGLPFRVPLYASDRFLTLITTDGGNSISFDNSFLMDPVLTLTTEQVPTENGQRSTSGT